MPITFKRVLACCIQYVHDLSHYYNIYIPLVLIIIFVFKRYRSPYIEF